MGERQRTAAELLADKFEMLETLGGGGMGHVYRARHKQLKRWVAIKVLSHDLEGAEAVTRFLREARAVAQIGSLHVAHVMDADVLPNGQPYIVMEYLQGRDLAAWIASEGKLPATMAVDCIMQALEAIAEAHALSIIHRDIKPGNLFATRGAGGDMLIKVLDFGLAKTSPSFDTLAPGITERGAVLGTPSYMSPEQYMDAQEADVRSDIWALGATLFELLTGTPPFTGNSLPQIYRAVIQRPIPKAKDVVVDLPQQLSEVVSTCLTREPERRFADVAQLAAALAPWAGPNAQARVERIQRILQSRPTPTSTGVSAPLDTRMRDPLRGLHSRTLAVSRAWSQAAWKRQRPRIAWGGLAIALTALAVISTTSKQRELSEHPEQGPASMPSLPSTTEVSASTAVDSLGSPLDAGVVTALDAALPQLGVSAGGTKAAPAGTTESTPSSAPKRGRKSVKQAAPGRHDPSVYEQYP